MESHIQRKTEKKEKEPHKDRFKYWVKNQEQTNYCHEREREGERESAEKREKFEV